MFATYSNNTQISTFGIVLRSAIAEITFVECFLKGRNNMHMLGQGTSRAAKNPAFYSSKYFGLAPVSAITSAVYTAVLDHNNGNRALETIVSMCPKMNMDLKLVLSSLIKFNSSTASAEEFINLYFKFQTSDKIHCYADLMNVLPEFSICENEITFSDWLNNVVLWKNKRTVRSSPIQVAFAMLILKYNNSEPAAVNALRSKMAELKVEYVFNRPALLKSSHQKDAQLIKIIVADDSDNAYNRALEKAKIIRAGLNFASGRAQEDELVRLVHGLTYFSKSKSPSRCIHNCLLYGFFYVRNEEWVRNHQNSLYQMFKKNHEKMQQILDAVSLWKPDVFSFEKLLLYMNKNQIAFLRTGDTDDVKILYDMEIAKWDGYINSVAFPNIKSKYEYILQRCISKKRDTSALFNEKPTSEALFSAISAPVTSPSKENILQETEICNSSLYSDQRDLPDDYEIYFSEADCVQRDTNYEVDNTEYSMANNSFENIENNIFVEAAPCNMVLSNESCEHGGSSENKSANEKLNSDILLMVDDLAEKLSQVATKIESLFSLVDNILLRISVKNKTQVLIDANIVPDIGDIETFRHSENVAQGFSDQRAFLDQLSRRFESNEFTINSIRQKLYNSKCRPSKIQVLRLLEEMVISGVITVSGTARRKKYRCTANRINNSNNID
ncbi:hypothetical protein ENBRE01_3187 [Enteropsectra breve]|nr:hypothetical protein ENBRE01_3187 [Enteropsectra breve]